MQRKPEKRAPPLESNYVTFCSNARASEVQLMHSGLSILLSPAVGSKLLAGVSITHLLVSELAAEKTQTCIRSHPPTAILHPPDIILMVCDPNLTLLFHCLLSTQTEELSTGKGLICTSTHSYVVYHSFSVVVLGMFTSFPVVIVIIRHVEGARSYD